YDFVRQEDIINANCAEPIIRQISRGVRWMLDDLATGTTFRVFRANWQFGMHHLVLQLLLLTWTATSMAAGTLAWYIARHWVGATTPISLAISVAAFFAIFMALRPLADQWLVNSRQQPLALPSEIRPWRGNLLLPADRERRRASQGIGACQ